MSVWYNMYHYSAYWGSWSRVLRHDGKVVEVNLTPIPCCHDSSWEKDVKPIRIRRHFTMDDRRDCIWKERSQRMTVEFKYCDGLYLSDSLPISIISAMGKQIGLPMVSRLLTEDFYSQIDWSKYEAANNGGASLDQIRKQVWM